MRSVATRSTNNPTHIDALHPEPMKRAPPINTKPSPRPLVHPGPEHAQLALREAATLMLPVALWLLRSGVTYPAFAQLLKGVFVEAAGSELARDQGAPTQSALSLLSGVHRKDVRALADGAPRERPTARPPLSSQVFTRWITDPKYRDAHCKPRALPRAGGRRGFESLCADLSNDVHPRAVLDELIRLGQVALEGDNVVVIAESFVPSAHVDELSALFSANAADHIAAAVSNLTSGAPKFLEQSVYADGLTPESIEQLHQAARKAWAQAFESVVTTARARVDLDNDQAGNLRMRFGAYYYSEPVHATPSARRRRSKPASKTTRDKS